MSIQPAKRRIKYLIKSLSFCSESACQDRRRNAESVCAVYTCDRRLFTSGEHVQNIRTIAVCHG